MIIKSLLDVDFYKYTMANVVYRYFPTAQVKYQFVCRTPGVNLMPYMDDIRYEINELSKLKLGDEESTYLRNIKFLNPAFIDYMDDLRLRPEEEVSLYNDGKNLTARIAGPWIRTIWYETMILAIVNEIYFRDKMPRENIVRNALSKLDPKIEMIKKQPNLKFSEFGTRRRHSFEVQHAILEALKHDVPQNLNGTSNVYLAYDLGLKPIGTQAHEYFMAHQALYRIQESQRKAMLNWAEAFDGNLGIALTDTINMDAFLRDFSLMYAKLFDGCRHDSGDPFVWCEKLIAHYNKLKIDPMTKMAVFSDGLNIPKAIDILNKFDGRIGVSFGIGTDLTNDLGVDPINIVIKMTECNGQPVAKISDTPGKNICIDDTYVAYLKRSFGI